MGDALEASWSMRGGDKGNGEQEALGEANKTGWYILRQGYWSSGGQNCGWLCRLLLVSSLLIGWAKTNGGIDREG